MGFVIVSSPLQTNLMFMAKYFSSGKTLLSFFFDHKVVEGFVVFEKQARVRFVLRSTSNDRFTTSSKSVQVRIVGKLVEPQKDRSIRCRALFLQLN